MSIGFDNASFAIHLGASFSPATLRYVTHFTFPAFSFLFRDDVLGPDYESESTANESHSFLTPGYPNTAPFPRMDECTELAVIILCGAVASRTSQCASAPGPLFISLPVLRVQPASEDGDVCLVSLTELPHTTHTQGESIASSQSTKFATLPKSADAGAAAAAAPLASALQSSDRDAKKRLKGRLERSAEKKRRSVEDQARQSSSQKDEFQVLLQTLQEVRLRRKRGRVEQNASSEPQHLASPQPNTGGSTAGADGSGGDGSTVDADESYPGLRRVSSDRVTIYGDPFAKPVSKQNSFNVSSPTGSPLSNGTMSPPPLAQYFSSESQHQAASDADSPSFPRTGASFEEYQKNGGESLLYNIGSENYAIAKKGSSCTVNSVYDWKQQRVDTWHSNGEWDSNSEVESEGAEGALYRSSRQRSHGMSSGGSHPFSSPTRRGSVSFNLPSIVKPREAATEDHSPTETHLRACSSTTTDSPVGGGGVKFNSNSTPSSYTLSPLGGSRGGSPQSKFPSK